MAVQPPLSRQRDRVDVAAIIRLAAMSGAAVTEEARRVRVGAEPQVLDAFDFSAFDPRPDVAGQIEHGVVFSHGRLEEFPARRIAGAEAFYELRPDLIVRLADQRPDRRRDPRSRRAELLHRGNCRLDDTGQRTFPAGM